jgi:hypothetical protein
VAIPPDDEPPGFDDGQPAPRLPRSRGVRVTVPQLLRIVITVVMLIAVVVTAKPCADATGRFISGFDPPDPQPAPPPLPKGQVRLTPDMTDAERAAAIANARAAVAADAGPAVAADAGPAIAADAGPAIDAGVPGLDAAH